MKTVLLNASIVTLLITLLSSCTKDEAIDSFVGHSRAGTYTENVCDSSMVFGDVIVDYATLIIEKTNENTATITCRQSVVGTLLEVSGVVASDSTLTIPSVVIDEQEMTGTYTHFKSTDIRRLELTAVENNCPSGTPNIFFMTTR